MVKLSKYEKIGICCIAGAVVTVGAAVAIKKMAHKKYNSARASMRRRMLVGKARYLIMSDRTDKYLNGHAEDK